MRVRIQGYTRLSNFSDRQNSGKTQSTSLFTIRPSEHSCASVLQRQAAIPPEPEETVQARDSARLRYSHYSVIADPPTLSSSTRNGSWPYGSCRTGHRLIKRSRKQLLSTNLRRPIGCPTATSVQNRDPSFSRDFLPIPSVPREQPARNRWDIEIFWEIRRKVQKNGGVDCAIGGRTGAFCKDRAGHALLADCSTNQRSAFIAVPLPFRGDEDRIGGSAIYPSRLYPQWI